MAISETVAIKTEKAAENLRWIRSERIERADESRLKAEQDVFQETFAAEMARIMDLEEDII